MEMRQFDAWSRSLALAGSRRVWLRRLAGGGIAAAAGATVAPGVPLAAAAPATPDTGTVPCVVGFAATIRSGPDAGKALAGTLALVAGAGGAIDRGYLFRREGGSLRVVGQATGRAINLLIDTGTGENVYGVGSLEQPLDQCAGEMGGPFVGPRSGDAGDWRVLPLAGSRVECESCVSKCGITCGSSCDAACTF
jgi:hypothetical protein